MLPKPTHDEQTMAAGRPRNEIPTPQQARELAQAFARFGKPQLLRGEDRRIVAEIIEKHWKEKKRERQEEQTMRFLHEVNDAISQRRRGRAA